MLIPRLRFKREDGTEYPEWEELSMNEIFTEIIEKNRPDLPVLSILQGQGTVYRDSSDRNILYDKKSTVNYKAMRKGDFIIHLRTFEGGLECATLDGISSPAYKILRTDKLISEAYKAYFRSKQFIEGRLAIAVTGVRDGKNIEMSTFWQILVPVACLEEQQKIADFLSTVDEVITQSEAEVQNLEKQKKAAMQKIFSQEVCFKREDGTEYPEWSKIKLSSILYEYKETCEKDGTYEHISLTKEGVVPKSERYERDFLVTDDSKKYRVTHIDDICYNPANLKFGVICRNKYGNGIFSPIYVTFKVCDGFLPEFIEMIVTRPDFIKYALRFQQGTVYERMAVSPEDLLSIIVSIPCLEEQKKIADFLSAYDEAISYAKQELEHWKQLKKGLLQQMFV